MLFVAWNVLSRPTTTVATTVVGLWDANNTSDSKFTDDGEEVRPLSPYSIKRPCELRNELLLKNKLGVLGAPHIDVERVTKHYTTDWNVTEDCDIAASISSLTSHFYTFTHG